MRHLKPNISTNRGLNPTIKRTNQNPTLCCSEKTKKQT